MQITLQHIEPPIWRRMLVPGGITFHKLHKIIQAAFDWQDYHEYSFQFEDFLVILPNPDFQFHETEKNPKKFKLEQVIDEYCQFTYEYDFGDGWEHEMIFEKAVQLEEEVHHPVCLDGERHRPPEDVGGPGGYEEFLRVIRDPEDEDHDHMLLWAEKDTGGRKFDPEYFYRQAANRKLAKITC
ncbi:plasmid pRiA4b ORF-3 family protein [Metabacillus sp. 113a]|uniref:plasmid pRiA4b ORF-3 family protein n=1 Tax=Metabacillus sp. 113a TaxID=3404706 RepID=UPI003CF0C071